MVFSPQSSLFVCALLFLCPWEAKSVDVSLLGSTGHLTGIVGSDDSNVAVPPAPPKCFIEGMKIFQLSSEDDIQMTAEICAEMEPIQQKALAFQIARCHLQDMGRKIIETFVGHINDLEQCVAPFSDDYDGDDYNLRDTQFPNLPACLESLTDSGVHAYTIFFANTVAICHKVTQHMVIGFQQHTAMELTKISQQAVELLHSTFESLYEHEAEMRKKHEDLHRAMKEHQERLRQEEASRMEAITTWATNVFNSWKTRDKEQFEKQDAWFQNFTQAFEKKTTELEQQYHQKLASANRFIQPLLTFDTVFAIAKQLYRLLAITLHGIFIMILCWLFTRPRCCRRTRRTLIAFALMETVGEICVHFLISDLVSEEQKKAMVCSLRSTAAGMEVLIYIVGTAMSCCWFPWGFGGEEEDDDEEEEMYGEEGDDDVSHDRHQRVTAARARQFQTDGTSTLLRARTDQSALTSPTAMLLDAHRAPAGTVPLGLHPTNTTTHSILSHHYGPRNDSRVVARKSGIFRSSATAALPSASDSGSKAVTKASIMAQVKELRSTSEDDRKQEAVPAKPTTPAVVDTRPRDVQNTEATVATGTLSPETSKTRSPEPVIKKRSPEKMDPSSDDSVNEESQSVDTSPMKRRRVEVEVEVAEAEKEKSSDGGVIQMDDEYQTATEDNGDGLEEESDDEDSHMAVEECKDDSETEMEGAS